MSLRQTQTSLGKKLNVFEEPAKSSINTRPPASKCSDNKQNPTPQKEMKKETALQTQLSLLFFPLFQASSEAISAE
jgi:hypothetical protein